MSKLTYKGMTVDSEDIALPIPRVITDADDTPVITPVMTLDVRDQRGRSIQSVGPAQEFPGAAETPSRASHVHFLLDPLDYYFASLRACALALETQVWFTTGEDGHTQRNVTVDLRPRHGCNGRGLLMSSLLPPPEPGWERRDQKYSHTADWHGLRVVDVEIAAPPAPPAPEPPAEPEPEHKINFREFL